MLDKIEVSFRELVSAIQTARLYSAGHPQFNKSVDKAYAGLKDVLSERENLVIGIIGEEIAVEKEIFFELSKTVKPMIVYLKSRGVERIEFLKGIRKEELAKFINFLVIPKEEIRIEPGEYLSGLGIENIIVGKIKAFGGLKEDTLTASLNYIDKYKNSLDSVGNSLESIINEEDIDRLALRQTVNGILDNLIGRHQDYLNFATVKRYDLRTFMHILNVSVLSMYFASKLEFARDEILDIGTAALFHDIGKMYISRKIIQKPAKLTDEEFTKIKSHVVIGAEILLKYVDIAGILSVIICFEHHLKYDLTGYPKVAFGRKPHIASLLVQICDVYDALSQKRGYKSDYPPKMIYEIMIKEKGGTFEPRLLDKFFEIIGVWPVGTIVALNDGRIAVVREENEDDIFSPKVEVIAPEDKKEEIDLKAAGERLMIERSLNPLNEGKDYLPLIYPP